MAGQGKSICLVQLQSTDINSHPFIGTAWPQHGQPGGTASAPTPHPMALHQGQNCALFVVIAGFPYLLHFKTFCRWNWPLRVLCTSEHLTATNSKAALAALFNKLGWEVLERSQLTSAICFYKYHLFIGNIHRRLQSVVLFPQILFGKKKKKCTAGVFNVQNPYWYLFLYSQFSSCFPCRDCKSQQRESSQELCRWRKWGL